MKHKISLIINDFKKTIQRLKSQYMATIPIELQTNENLLTAIDTLEKEIPEIDAYAKAKVVNRQLQMLNHAVISSINDQTIKNKLSTFFSIDQTCIKELEVYKENLSHGNKLQQTKACSLAKIVAKLHIIQQTANSYEPMDRTVVEQQIQALNIEIKKEKVILGKYRGISFFRPFLQCLGHGRITSLEYLKKLEINIDDCKKALYMSSM